MEPRVIKSISRPAANLVKELAQFESATVHEAYGARGALASEIKPIDSRIRLCGPAVTVSCRPGDNLFIHKAIYVAEPGDVLLVSVGEFTEGGPWGEIMTVAAQQRGIAGYVTDGSVRDTQAMRELHFPVFSRGVCIKGTTKDTLGWINHPLMIGGVSVQPGDVVLGDAEGVVVVAAQDLAGVVEQCRARVAKEEKIMAELRKGKSTLELYGFDKILQAKGIKE